VRGENRRAGRGSDIAANATRSKEGGWLFRAKKKQTREQKSREKTEERERGRNTEKKEPGRGRKETVPKRHKKRGRGGKRKGPVDLKMRNENELHPYGGGIRKSPKEGRKSIRHGIGRIKLGSGG